MQSGTHCASILSRRGSTRKHDADRARRTGGLFRVCLEAEAQFVLNFFTSMKLTAVPLNRAVSTVPALLEKPAA